MYTKSSTEWHNFDRENFKCSFSHFLFYINFLSNLMEGIVNHLELTTLMHLSIIDTN